VTVDEHPRRCLWMDEVDQCPTGAALGASQSTRADPTSRLGREFGCLPPSRLERRLRGTLILITRPRTFSSALELSLMTQGDAVQKG
jgi:hypothetical protein